MARLRHIGICVKDLETTTAFYKSVFGLEEVKRETIPIGSAVYLSDGVINLALLSLAPGNKVATNHFGFQVEDLEATGRAIEEAGGTYFFEIGKEEHGNFERKFKDPDGLVFDISRVGWFGTDGFAPRPTPAGADSHQD